MKSDNYLDISRELDRSDKLAPFRDRFFHSEENAIYLDGNSLGRMPLKAISRVDELMRKEWGDRLIRSWNEHWMELPGRVSGMIAEFLGAGPNEIMVGDSTSVNLYKLVFSVLKFQKSRRRIISDSLNFPSDLYILKGLINEHFSSHHLDILESNDGISIPIEKVAESLNEETALMTLSHVTYKSSSMYDVKEINSLAHQKGVLVIWDLSHSAGAVPVQLNDWDTDLAVGCTYKYLNGGPGSPAYLFVKEELQEKLSSPVWGWFGHNKPFDFSNEYRPAESLNRFAAGTPNIISMAPVEIGLEILLEAGIEDMRKKSIEQTEFLVELIKKYLYPLGFELASPELAEHRGSHLSIRHPEGYRINKAMINPEGMGVVVVPDFRPPDNIRLGIAPLYISFQDIYHAVRRIESIVINREYEGFNKNISGVT